MPADPKYTMNPEFFIVTFGAGGSRRSKTLHSVMAIAQAGHEAAPHGKKGRFRHGLSWGAAAEGGWPSDGPNGPATGR